MSWLPMLLIENAGWIRASTASIDKVANEIKGLRDTPVNIDLGQLLSHPPRPGLEHKNGSGNS